MQSGINLSSDQSPPPITFPALVEQILTGESSLEKKDLKYELIAISAAAFEELYGSIPPNLSVSLYP